MAVGGGIAHLVDILQCFQRPAGSIFFALCVDAGQRIHIRPLLIPVAAQSHQRTIRDRTVLCFIGLDVLHCHSVARVFLGLLGNIDDHQRENQVIHIKLFGQRFALDEVTREVDMGTKLSREFEGLDQAFQFRLAPVPHGLCQLHRAFRDTGPVGAFVVQRVRKFHPAIFFSILQCVPQFIISHCRFSFYCDDVCSGTSPRQRHLPVFSQSVCREFVWEQRIRPGSLCRASAVCFICLRSLPCVGDSINPFSYHVNRFILSKTSRANDRSANRSPLQ